MRKRVIKSGTWISAIAMLTVILGTISMVNAQEASTLPIDPSDSEFRAQFDNQEFNNRFAVLATTDAVNNYFMADFSQFPGKFEKIWFLNLIFRSDKIVNIDPGIDRDRIWFVAKRMFDKQEVLDEFDELKASTLKASAKMTVTEKSEWMEINDKYK